MKQLLLEDNEIQAILAFMDAGVKSLGLSCVENAAFLKKKLESAPDVEIPKPAVKPAPKKKASRRKATRS